MIDRTARRRLVVGLMGPGKGASPEAMELAKELGSSIAARGWVLLNGGRSVG